MAQEQEHEYLLESEREFSTSCTGDTCNRVSGEHRCGTTVVRTYVCACGGEVEEVLTPSATGWKSTIIKACKLERKPGASGQPIHYNEVRGNDAAYNCKLGRFARP